MLLFAGLAALAVVGLVPSQATLLPGTSLPPSGYMPMNHQYSNSFPSFNTQPSFQYQNFQQYPFQQQPSYQQRYPYQQPYQQQQWNWNQQFPSQFGNQYPSQYPSQFPQFPPQPPVSSGPIFGGGQAPECRGYTCSMTRDPVCGLRMDGTNREFTNLCDYEGHTKCNPGAFITYVKGPCSPTKREEQSPSPRPQPSPPTQHPRPSPPQQNPAPGQKTIDAKVLQCIRNQKCETIHKPVCGLNSAEVMETFINKCDYESLQKCDPTNYNQKDFTEGYCPMNGQPGARPYPNRNPVSQCGAGRACGMNYAPICAHLRDGTTKTFGNKCGYDIELECEPTKFTGRTTSGRCEEAAKPTPQPEQYPPAQQPGGRQQTGPGSQCGAGRACPMNYAPICAHLRDGTTKTFGNKCGYDIELECEPTKFTGRTTSGRCEEAAKPAPKPEQYPPAQQPGGRQQTGPGSQCGAGRACPMNYAPICAHLRDGTTKTFGNKCGYDIELECEPTKFTGRTTSGRCEEAAKSTPQPEQYPPAQQPGGRQQTGPGSQCGAGRACPMNYAPICAHLRDGTTKTYGNKCGYDIELECEPTKFTGRTTSGRCEEAPRSPPQHQHPDSRQQPTPSPQCGPVQCPMISAPVCAILADGTTKEFGNDCTYKAAKDCNPSNFSQQPVVKGRCSEYHNRQKQPEQQQPNRCSGMCPHNYAPICATMTDGTTRTFSNDCAYEMEKDCNPKHKLSGEKRSGRCDEAPKNNQQSEQYPPSRQHQHPDSRQQATTSPQCGPVQCPMISAPVCAIMADGTTKEFGNDCTYRAARDCNPTNFNHQPATKGRCSENRPSGRPDDRCQSRVCPANYAPVCAVMTDGTTKTFSNDCAYSIEKDCNPSLKFSGEKRMGRCEEPQQPNQYPRQQPSQYPRQEHDQHPRQQTTTSPQCGPVQCPMISAPVCATLANGYIKEFGNDCTYRAAKDCNPSQFTEKVTKGRCGN